MCPRLGRDQFHEIASSLWADGCVDWEKRVSATPERPRLVNWPSGPQNSIQAFTLLTVRSFGMEEHPCFLTDGSREQCPTGGFEAAGAGVYLPAPEEAFRGAVWGTVEECGDARYESVAWHCCRCHFLSRLSSVLNSAEPSWPCRPSGLGIWVLVILMWSGAHDSGLGCRYG